jgi:hypothetical protein
VAVAVGQPVGQAQVGKDDPLAQSGIAAGGGVLQSAIDLAGGGVVSGSHRNDLIGGSLRGWGCG